jgi:hypothetical protein
MESKISMREQINNSTNTCLPLYSKDGKDLHVTIRRERAHELEDLGLVRIIDDKVYKNGGAS